VELATASAARRASLALARMIVKDGEGVTKFIEIELRGAASAKDARRAAEAVANSTLAKCAWAGGDPNWGRIMDALGYSGAKMREEKTAIFYNDLPIVENGVVAKTPWSKLRAIAAKPEFRIVIDLKVGKFSHTVWTTDLTEEYVRLNLGE
jgi:glutamate N-acetyltransferase/amino-acid N-acetyltransferase